MAPIDCVHIRQKRWVVLNIVNMGYLKWHSSHIYKEAIESEEMYK